MTVRVTEKPSPPSVSIERTELILGQLDQLPTLPVVAARLIELTSNNESCLDEVVRVVQSDAALSATLLGMVRRADMGVRGKELDLQRAVALLGFRQVRNVVLSAQLFGVFDSADVGDRTSETRTGIWKHNLAVACAAELLADRLNDPALRTEAFLCGLLHDIGKTALDCCMPKAYARVVEQVDREMRCICDVERAVFGLDHTMAGKRLATRWHLPESAIECIWLHHQDFDSLPSGVRFPKLIKTIHLGDHLVRSMGIGFSGYQHIENLNELADQLDLPRGTIDELIAQLPDRVAPLMDAIGLDHPTDAQSNRQRQADAMRELARANSELIDTNRKLTLESRCLAAISSFVELSPPTAHLGDTCSAAAGSVRALCQGKQALAFCADHAARCIHIGVAPDGYGRLRSTVCEWDPEERSRAFARSEFGAFVGTFVECNEASRDLWLRTFRSEPADPLWLFPISDDSSALTGVVVAAPETAILPLRANNRRWDALTGTLATALSASQSQRDSARMTEELVDLNRRFKCAQKELLHTSSISMIAAMAAGAAHEMHNPLSVISGRAQLELNRCDDEQTKHSLQVIVEQTNKTSEIIMDLMRYAKPDPPTPMLQKLAPLLDGLCQHWRSRFSLEEDQLLTDVHDPSATVYADPGQLQEILDALVTNAVEACAAESVSIKINSPSRASDETVRIVVMDNGVGMASDVLERAPDPFYSSRPAGRGRGLGLSRAQRMAEINDGKMQIESRPGIGTTITVSLPSSKRSS